MNQSILNRARLDKFDLILDLPEALKRENDSILKDKNHADSLQFTVFGSPVPSIKIPPISLSYGGQTFHVSSHTRPAYPTLDLKFLVDSNYANYWLLWKWLNLFNNSLDGTTDMTQMSQLNPINSPQPSWQVTNNTLTKYMSNFTLYSLDEYNNKVTAFNYKGAFITSLGELNYSHQDEAIINGSVSFVYNQFDMELLTNLDEGC